MARRKNNSVSIAKLLSKFSIFVYNVTVFTGLNMPGRFRFWELQQYPYIATLYDFPGMDTNLVTQLLH